MLANRPPMGWNSWNTFGPEIDEQVIREIYARPFEHALKEGNSTGIMGSFNRIGNINAQLNGAMKSLVHDEWDNRAIFETDAW